MDKDHNYAMETLERNNFFYWKETDPLPEFVVAKVNQFEAKRPWSHWLPEVWSTHTQCVKH